jgi:hypothetical protein
VRALLVALALAAGCATATPTPDRPAPGPRVALRLSAVDDGHGLSGADFGLELVLGAERWAPLGASVDLDDGAPMQLQCATWGMGSAAATANAGGVAVDCLYLSGLGPERRVALLAHEVGHLLGLDHVDDPHATMYPEANDSTGLAPADVAEYRRANPQHPGETP